MIHYEVVKQGKYWAIRRHGKRGGMKPIAVYTSEYPAVWLASELNRWTENEA